MPVLPKHSDSNTRKRAIPSFYLRWCFGFFVVSGFCGLVYEVVWLRLAMASFGVTTALVSIVISMFMAGLGLGSWGAGVLTRRVMAADGPRALRLYSIAELLVGISSLAVPLELKLGRLLLQQMGSFGAWQTSRYYFLAGIWVAITLVPWCTCMGSTFPLLMAVIRQAARSTSERSFSYLYIANVLGAFLGTIVSAFVLIELLGFQGTLYVAGSLNAILALLAFAISFSLVSSPSIEMSNSRQATRTRLYGLPLRAILFFLFTTGLVSMGMEVVWIREFTPYLGNVVYAFAAILAVYLLATVVGSQDYRSRARSRQPGESASAWGLLALFAVIPVVAADPRLPLGAIPIVGLRLCSIVLFCAMAGFLTPLLVDSWSSGDPDRAGTAYAVNIAGSIVGPLIAGFWLLPWLGERWAIFALSIPLFAIAALTMLRKPSSEIGQPKSGLSPRLKFALAAVSAILLFSMSRDFETIFPVREVRRDYTATVLAAGKGFDRILLVNGVGMTSLTPITKYIAHLPLAFMSRPPQNGLVICFGMGTSFRSMLSWGIPTTTVDLVPSVPALFGYFHADAPKLVSSPLARIVIDDGRRFLDGSNQTYDVIVVDPPPPPQAAGSSLLYSREFYEVVKKHLRSDGILQTWYPGTMGDTATAVSISKALMQSFPYVRAFSSYDGFGIHFLASMEPIPITPSSVLAERMPPAAASDFVEWGPQTTPQQQFELVLSRELTLENLVAEDPRVPAMRDDQPINEYYLLRSWLHSYR
ncbi:MAG: fused MFS/spermidine synthase [Terracidiphilus sp.]|jgi:predicted membrane-bound spermidine synthase